MLKFTRGSLIRLIDVNGDDKGFATYIDLHSPGFIPSGGKQFDGFWHFSAIDVNGELRYFSTHNWTPVLVDPDSCNP